MKENSEVHYKQTEEGDVLTDDAGSPLQLAPSEAVSTAAVVYTFGEGEEYDIQFNPAKNIDITPPDADTIPLTAVVKDGWVTLTGNVWFDGASSGSEVVDFSTIDPDVREALRPYGGIAQTTSSFFDESEAAVRMVNCFWYDIEPHPDWANFTISPLGAGGDFASGEWLTIHLVWLSAAAIA